MNTVTTDMMVERWSSPASRPLFRGKLIDEEGCCCAQGDVLRCAGLTDEDLRRLDQAIADREVSKILGISLAEAILIRVVNDRADGCPQDVFRDRARVLGPHHELWTAFARHIDTIDADGWRNMSCARDASWAAAGDAAWAASRAVAGADAGVAGRDAARDSALAVSRVVAGVIAADAAGGAAGELVGWSKLDRPYFLKFFFDDPAAWVESVSQTPQP